jgi:flagellar biosynthesis anti-sigma factor FlgM
MRTAAKRALASSKHIETPLARKKVDSLADEARRLSKIAVRTAESSEIRDERVATIREALQNGTYQPSSVDMADSLLKETLAF